MLSWPDSAGKPILRSTLVDKIPKLYWYYMPLSLPYRYTELRAELKIPVCTPINKSSQCTVCSPFSISDSPLKYLGCFSSYPYPYTSTYYILHTPWYILHTAYYILHTAYICMLLFPFTQTLRCWMLIAYCHRLVMATSQILYQRTLQFLLFLVPGFWSIDFFLKIYFIYLFIHFQKRYINVHS